jgi:hypothetical protein
MASATVGGNSAFGKVLYPPHALRPSSTKLNVHKPVQAASVQCGSSQLLPNNHHSCLRASKRRTTRVHAGPFDWLKKQLGKGGIRVPDVDETEDAGGCIC